MPVTLPLASEAVFLTASGVLVAFALVVSVLGLRSTRFAGDGRTGRAVMGLAVLLALVAMAGAVISAESTAEGEREPLQPPKDAGPPPAPLEGAAAAPAPSSGAEATGPATKTVKIAADKSGQLAYDVKAVKAKAGKVTIDFDNPSPTEHDVAVEQGGKELGRTAIVTGKKTSTTIDLKKGEYVFFCSVPGHRQAGMEGKLTVE